MPNQLTVLFVTLVLFCVMMKREYSLKILVLSIVAGAMTLIGEYNNGVYILYALMDGLITFLMWYSIIIAVILVIRFFSRVPKEK